MKKVFLVLSLIAICNILSAQVVDGFQINHNFLKNNNTIQKGLYCTVQLKSITKITADSGIIATTNKLYYNRDIADVTPDSNLIIGKQIIIDYALYALPSNETMYFYGKHIGMETPVEAVIEETLIFNYSISVGIKKSEIIKN